MNKQAYIYTLSDPRDKSVRYVGSTNNIFSRYKSHRAINSNDSEAMTEWKISLRTEGKKPIMTLVETCTPDDRPEYEQQWIAYYLLHGNELLNIRDIPNSRDALRMTKKVLWRFGIAIREVSEGEFEHEPIEAKTIILRQGDVFYFKRNA